MSPFRNLLYYFISKVNVSCLASVGNQWLYFLWGCYSGLVMPYNNLGSALDFESVFTAASTGIHLLYTITHTLWHWWSYVRMKVNSSEVILS